MSEARQIPAAGNLQSASGNNAMVKTIPKLVFTVCEDDDENLHVVASSDDDDGDDEDDDTPDTTNQDADAGFYGVFPYEQEEEEAMDVGMEPFPTASSKLLTLPKLQFNLRKMSDHGLKQLRHQLRRMSGVTGRLSTSCTSNGSGSYIPDRLAVPAISRKMSIDSAGILKHQVEHETRKRLIFQNLKLSRKSVSFCHRDNVRIYDDDKELHDVDDDEDEADNNNAMKPVPLPGLSGKSLVPTFVFAGKRPNYANIFEGRVIILESLNITEDFCLMGNIRVNMTLLRNVNKDQDTRSGSITVKQRASVSAMYTFDGWQTYKETKAMVVKAQLHPALTAFETHAMRFYVDCDEMEIGDAVEFAVSCSDRRQTVKKGTKVTKQLRTGIGNEKGPQLTTTIRKYRDDNDGKFYRIKCTKKLNLWAEKAVRELKNFTPVVKFNKNFQ